MSPSTTPITVAVCTRNRAHLFGRYVLPSLVAIAANHVPVIVVDQSDDDATEKLVARINGATYLRSGPGLSVGRNTAVAAVETPLMAFTDDDVSFEPGWPTAMTATFDAEPEVGMVCGRAVDPGGRQLPGAAAGRYRWPLNPFGLGSGFNMGFRIAALHDAGPFDHDLGAGARIPAGEDTDMLYRVARAGWTIACVDGIEVVHHDWRDEPELGPLHYAYGLGAGAQTAKHLRRGDRTAARIGAREAARHVRTIGQATRSSDRAQRRRQFAFLAGMAVGFTKTLVPVRARGERGRSAPRRSESR